MFDAKPETEITVIIIRLVMKDTVLENLQVAAKETMKTINHLCLWSNIVYGGWGVVDAGGVESGGLPSGSSLVGDIVLWRICH